MEHIIHKTLQNSQNSSCDQFLVALNKIFIYADHAINNETTDLSGFINHQLKVTRKNRRFGIGLMLGEPSGLNIKWWCNESIDFEALINHYRSFANSWWTLKSVWLPRKNAWDFSLAFPIIPDGFLHFHFDYLWHNYRVFPSELGIVPLYYGLGGRIRFGDENHYGLRGVFGVDYLFIEFPIDVFMEIAPIFNVLPKIGMDFNMFIGLRINLK